jgi:hypothetical protein
MSNKKISKNFVDVEAIGLAAARRMTLAEAGIEETEKNKELFRILLAETDKIYKNGSDVDIAG